MKWQQFHDRSQAGQLLAASLTAYEKQPDVLVLGLLRGGIPVAFEVARSLHAPLDVMIVRKLGVPGEEELAMGAIASGGVCVLNEGVVRHLALTEEVIERAIAREKEELERREHLYRGHRPAHDIRGRTVILVDDGMATGATMRAAVAAIRQQQPRDLIIAVPVASSTTCQEFAAQGEKVVCLIAAETFLAVGFWYASFPQTSDAEVGRLLAQAAHEWTSSQE